MVEVNAMYNFRLEDTGGSLMKVLPVSRVGFNDTWGQLFREPSEAKIIKNLPDLEGLTVIAMKPASSLNWPVVLNIFPDSIGFGRSLAPAHDAILVKRIHDEFQAIIVKGMKYLGLPLLQQFRHGKLDKQIQQLYSALN